MTMVVISIITSLNWLKKLPTVSTLSPNFARIIPTISANKMIGSISPLASAPSGLVGMIFSSVSGRLTLPAMATSLRSMEDISSPTPGFITLATSMAAVMARAVVKR